MERRYREEEERKREGEGRYRERRYIGRGGKKERGRKGDRRRGKGREIEGDIEVDGRSKGREKW